jgi:hypothetical protein
MATTYKRSGVQGTSSVDTYATLYTVPASTSSVISTIAICNTASAAATYRIGFDDTAGTPTASEWLVYDATVSGNDTIALSLGVSIEAEKYIRVSSSADTVTFQAFVSEIS